MTGILDKLAAQRASVPFAPATIRHLLVLRLARKLGEPSAAEHYAELARIHHDATLLLAYRRTMNHGHPPRDLARRFHEALASANEQMDEDPAGSVLAIKVERRSIAVAVFVGMKLEYHDLRHLSSSPEKADTSAITFLAWVVDTFGIDSAALERMTNGDEIRRAGLNRTVTSLLRERAIPVWDVRKQDLLDAYGHPSLKTRQELRQAAHNLLWPEFNTETPNGQELDAAALGLHIQIERQFYRP